MSYLLSGSIQVSCLSLLLLLLIITHHTKQRGIAFRKGALYLLIGPTRPGRTVDNRQQPPSCFCYSRTACFDWLGSSSWWCATTTPKVEKQQQWDVLLEIIDVGEMKWSILGVETVVALAAAILQLPPHQQWRPSSWEGRAQDCVLSLWPFEYTQYCSLRGTKQSLTLSVPRARQKRPIRTPVESQLTDTPNEWRSCLQHKVLLFVSLIVDSGPWAVWLSFRGHTYNDSAYPRVC